MSPMIVCFHHAGGSASVFRAWGPNRELDLHPVQLPGREDRRAEPAHTRIDTLVAQLDAELDPLLDEQHVFFGHSMGALIAHALLRRRQQSGRRLPDALVVAAAAAPHLHMLDLPLETMSDLEVAETLSSFGGIPPALLARPEWLSALLAPVKADLWVCRSVRQVAPAPIPVPLHALGGTADTLVTPDRVAAWEEHAGAGFTLTMIDAGHFVVTENGAQVQDLLRRVVAELTVLTG